MTTTNSIDFVAVAAIYTILDHAGVNRSVFWAASADWRGIDLRTDPRPMRQSDILVALAVISTSGQMRRALEALDRHELPDE